MNKNILIAQLLFKEAAPLQAPNVPYQTPSPAMNQYYTGESARADRQAVNNGTMSVADQTRRMAPQGRAAQYYAQPAQVAAVPPQQAGPASKGHDHQVVQGPRQGLSSTGLTPEQWEAERQRRWDIVNKTPYNPVVGTPKTTTSVASAANNPAYNRQKGAQITSILNKNNAAVKQRQQQKVQDIESVMGLYRSPYAPVYDFRKQPWYTDLQEALKQRFAGFKGYV